MTSKNTELGSNASGIYLHSDGKISINNASMILIAELNRTIVGTLNITNDTNSHLELSVKKTDFRNRVVLDNPENYMYLYTHRMLVGNAGISLILDNVAKTGIIESGIVIESTKVGVVASVRNITPESNGNIGNIATTFQFISDYSPSMHGAEKIISVYYDIFKITKGATITPTTKSVGIGNSGDIKVYAIPKQ